MKTAFLALLSVAVVLPLSSQPKARDSQDPVQVVLRAARECLEKRDFAGAYENLRKGLKERPASSDLLVQLGRTYLANDSTDAAIVAFSQARIANPSNPEAYEGLGDSYGKQGATMIAVSQYAEAIKHDSLHAEAYYKLAHAYMKLRQYNEAAHAYESVARIDSTNTSALLELGKLFLAAKQYPHAARVLQLYTERDPSSAEGWALSMEAAIQARQFVKASEAAEKVLAQNPSSARALQIRAQAQVELHEFDKALATYAKLAASDTLNALDLRQRGKAYSDTKQDSLAMVSFNESLAIDSVQADTWGDLGAVLMRMHRFDAAASAFERRYMLEPASISSYVNYALSSMAVERWNDALRALRYAATLKADYLPIPLNIGRCLIRIDSLKESIPYYETVISLGAGGDKYQSELAEAYSIVGLGHLLKKEYTEAIESLNASIKLRDDAAQPHLWLAQTFALLNKRDQSIKEYKTVLKLDPKNKDAKKGLELLGE